MRTTYFWKATHEPEPGVRYVSISRQNLRGAENMEKYPALMPDWKLINLAHEMGYSKECFEVYRKEYFDQLKNLDAEKVYQELQDCVLVCFESPKDIVSGKKILPPAYGRWLDRNRAWNCSAGRGQRERCRDCCTGGV